MSRKKIAFIGAGQIGASSALLSAMKELGDVVICDVMQDMPMGKALDLSHMCAIEGLDVTILGANDISKIAGADVIIITAGIARKPGMSRDDLLAVNKKIITDVGYAVKEHCRNAFSIVITNPLDAMVAIYCEASGVNSKKVVGMAGVLDSARFKYLIAKKLNVSVQDVNTIVLGGHGDTMVPLPRFTTVGGVSIPELIKMGMITEDDVNEICDQVRNGGAEIVALLKTGSAFYAPASAAIAMAESYLKDKRRILPCAAYLNGEYGVKGLYIGVPCIIGKDGVEKVIELPLNEYETKLVNQSIDQVRKLYEASCQIKIDDKPKVSSTKEENQAVQIKSNL